MICPYFSIQVSMAGLAVEDIPAMLDEVAARIRRDSFDQVGLVQDRAGDIVGTYRFAWGDDTPEAP